eukprot:4388064-Prymnesium_polylepis.1
MAAEELAQATRRAMVERRSSVRQGSILDAKKTCTRCARSCRERFANLPFWSAAAASHCVVSARAP